MGQQHTLSLRRVTITAPHKIFPAPNRVAVKGAGKQVCAFLTLQDKTRRATAHRCQVAGQSVMAAALPFWVCMNQI